MVAEAKLGTRAGWESAVRHGPHLKGEVVGAEVGLFEARGEDVEEGHGEGGE